MAPKVSVLMPVFNNAPYLDEAVRSVLAQTFRDFELIARDDGSGDESLNILRRYAAQDDRLRLLMPGQHLGIAGGRNALARAARGTYLATMDADDVCMPTRLATQVQFLDEHPAYVGCGTWIEQSNAKGKPIRIMTFPSSHEEIDAGNIEGCMSL